MVSNGQTAQKGTSAGRKESAAAAADFGTEDTADKSASARTDRLLGAHAPGIVFAVLRASAQRQR